MKKILQTFQFYQMKKEVERIQWSKRKEVIKDSLYTLFFIVFFSSFFSLFYFLISLLLKITMGGR